MPIKDMPAFVFSHKHIRNAVYYSLASCMLLLLQLLLMDKNVLNVVFDIIIPFTAAITFGCYAITMAMDRPVILICPPTVYFVSLLINQLIAVEVGTEDTYPFIIIAELIPFTFFCISAATDKFKKISTVTIKLFCAAIIIACLTLGVLAIFFRIKLFTSTNHYIKQTFSMICGLLAVFFIYTAMIELLKISGCEKRVRNRE